VARVGGPSSRRIVKAAPGSVEPRIEGIVRLRSSAMFTGLALCIALGQARAENDEPASAPTITGDAIRLTPPALLRALASPARHVALPESRDARRHAGVLSLDLSFSYLRLAVHGDGSPGLSTFLGTSTTSLGGFRLRF